MFEFIFIQFTIKHKHKLLIYFKPEQFLNKIHFYYDMLI